MRSARTLVVGAGVVYLVGLLVVAAWPTPVDAALDVRGSWPVTALIAVTGLSPSVGYRVVEAAANVVLFVPLGALGAWSLPQWSWWRIALAGAAVSVVVEVGQGVLSTDRVATWTDVVANAAGAALGAFVASHVLHRGARGRHRA